MKWIEAIFSTIKEYLKRVNKVPQKDIDAREREKTETKGIKSDNRQIRLTKKNMRKFEKWYRWAKRKGFIKEGDDKYEAFEKYKSGQN